MTIAFALLLPLIPAAKQDTWQRNLDSTAAAIHDALSDRGLSETARRAEYFNLLRELRQSTEAIDEDPAISAFLGIMLFCDLFLVQWYVVEA